MPFLAPIIIVVLAILTASAPAARAEESVLLDNGNRIFVYPLLETPRELRRDMCDRYAFQTGNYELLEDGQYKTADGDAFLVFRSCLLSMTGSSTLDNGTPVEFYQEDSFNTEGNLVFTVDASGARVFVDGVRTALAGWTGVDAFNALGESVTTVTGAIFVICVLAFRRGIMGELIHRLPART